MGTTGGIDRSPWLLGGESHGAAEQETSQEEERNDRTPIHAPILGGLGHEERHPM